jgi:hypothetical protein
MKTKQATKKRHQSKVSSTPSRKRTFGRGLNEDDQNRITNVPDDEEIEESRISPEAEEEREKRRRIEDARRDEEEY